MDDFKNRFTVFDTPLESEEYKDLKKEWNSIKSSSNYDLAEFNLQIPEITYYPDPFKNKSLLNTTNNTNIMDNYFDESLYENPTINYNPTTLGSTSDNHVRSNYIINYFIDKGLTEAQARGIYGNIMQESAGKINARSSDGHNSYGIAQWTGDRKTKLFKMYGTNPTLDEQLEFLWWELNNTEKAALADLKKTTSVYDATKSFMNKFERPSKKYANFNNRLKYANS